MTGLDDLDLHEDLIDYTGAASLAGVPETTVRQWKSRHTLQPAGVSEQGRLLFRPIDVLRAEAATRNKGRHRDAQAG